MGLRARRPAATDAQLRRHLADLLLGCGLAERAYGPLPQDERDAGEQITITLLVVDALEQVGVRYVVGARTRHERSQLSNWSKDT